MQVCKYPSIPSMQVSKYPKDASTKSAKGAKSAKSAKNAKTAKSAKKAKRTKSAKCAKKSQKCQEHSDIRGATSISDAFIDDIDQPVTVQCSCMTLVPKISASWFMMLRMMMWGLITIIIYQCVASYDVNCQAPEMHEARHLDK